MPSEVPPDLSQSSQDAPALTLEVNVEAMQGKVLVQLQHLLDVTAISLQGVERVDEVAYASFRRFFMLQPAGDLRLTRDGAASAAADWNLRNAFRDGIESIGSFLDECRIVLALCTRLANGVTVGDFDRIAGAEARRFHRMGLPEKLARLKQDFNVVSSLAVHVMTVNAVRNCLVHRGGITSMQDVSEGALKLCWRVMQLYSEKDGQTVVFDGTNVGLENAPILLRAVDHEKSFQLGERVALSYEELVHTFMTLMLFVIDMAEQVNRLFTQAMRSKPTNT